MNVSRLPIWLPIGIVATALLATVSLVARHRVEAGNQATGLAVELETVEGLAAAQGIPLDRALDQLKAQGVNAMVLSEETVAELVAEGRLRPDSASAYGFSGDPASNARLSRAFAARFPAFRDGGMRSGVPIGAARATSVGLNPEQAQIARDRGFAIIARFSNPVGADRQTVRETLSWAHELGATVFLPQGETVLGRRDALPATVEALEELDMTYVTPEFGKIGGDANIVAKIPGRIVRLHSAQAQELDRLSLPDAVERYAKAARERNIRYLLIRPLSPGAEAPLSAFVDFVKRIHRQLLKEGGAVGTPRPFAAPEVPRPVFPLLALAAMSVVGFLGITFVRPTGLRIAGWTLLGLLGVACWTDAARPFAALLAALAFPVAAFVALDRGPDALRRPLVGFLTVVGISLVGGLTVAGLLNDLPYYVKADVFPGVKLAVFLPVVAVFLYFATQGLDLKAELRNPITWGAATFALVVLAVLGFMLTRTGNDGPAGVSPTELAFRNLLDNVLYVRPRTKEFLIGHPLLVVGIGMLNGSRREGKGSAAAIWAALALAGGAIGATSVVNTLCHLHTPIALNLVRIAIGALLGCIIGLVLWGLVRRALPRIGGGT